MNAEGSISIPSRLNIDVFMPPSRRKTRRHIFGMMM